MRDLMNKNWISEPIFGVELKFQAIVFFNDVKHIASLNFT